MHRFKFVLYRGKLAINGGNILIYFFKARKFPHGNPCPFVQRWKISQRNSNRFSGPCILQDPLPGT